MRERKVELDGLDLATKAVLNEMMTILHGDCIEVMATMDASSVDAIVTDPPYGLGFMGKKWDRTGIASDPATWEACLRVLKPGGTLLAFGGSRTFHRIAVAIEDAGFEIRDTLSWLYGSGFPKSLDVSKAIDKAAGAEREVIGYDDLKRKQQTGQKNTAGLNDRIANDGRITAPATPEAEQWQGWGTALKPAWEPIIVARKPLTGTVVGNVLTHGTGAINVDGCRIGENGGHRYREGQEKIDAETVNAFGNGLNKLRSDKVDGLGRWPANVLLDEDAAEAAGEWSRYFYTAKSSRSERNAGLDTPSNHPTVKPLTLMRWLVRLVTPPGGLVLDPFTGSGTTGCAAALEGFGFIGIEQDAEYVEIARKRIAHWTPTPEPQLALDLGATTQ